MQLAHGDRTNVSHPESDDLFLSLSDTHKNFETPCGTYAHLKLARYLLRVTGDSKYGDSMEQIIYNTVLGAKPLQQDGHAFYYSDYNFDAKKVYHKEKWTCCSGTLPQVTCDYHACVSFHKGHNLYVNLYLPSTVVWNVNDNPVHKVVIKQETDYPFEDKVKIGLSMKYPVKCALHFRIPAWARTAASITINAKQMTDADSVKSTEHGFLCVEREWRDGDVVELGFPMKLQLVPISSKHLDVCALTYGPIVLFGLTVGKPKITREQLL